MIEAVRIARPHVIEHVRLAEPDPQRGHVLVRVRAVGVCMSDLEILEGTRPAPYVRYPIIPGHEWAGEVLHVGEGVSGVAVGDRVAVEGHNFCGSCFHCRRGETNLCETYDEFGFVRDGAYGGMVRVRADLAHRFDAALPWDHAALTEPAACAGNGMLRAGVRAGDTVCVIGPGTIGLLGVAWARALGAAKVAVIGIDRANEALARAAGATHYLTAGERPMEALRAITGGRGADVVLEAAGAPAAVPLAFDAARRGGSVVLMGIVGGGKRLDVESDVFCLKELHVHGVFAYSSAVFEQTLRKIESGALNVAPLITHRMPLRDVARAMDLMKRKHEPVAKIILNP